MKKLDNGTNMIHIWFIGLNKNFVGCTNISLQMISFTLFFFFFKSVTWFSNHGDILLLDIDFYSTWTGLNGSDAGFCNAA